MPAGAGTEPSNLASMSDVEHAEDWATTILRVLRTPHPWGAAHTSTGPDDCDVTPQRLHPAFHGCLDWHSSVHMQWSAITLLQLAELSSATTDELLAELDARLTGEHCEVERRYLEQRPGYERPYGWGWLVMLAAQATSLAASDHRLAGRARGWAEALVPVADQVASNLLAWLPKLAHPVRHGVHTNTAFGLTLARDGFEALGRLDVVRAIDAAAQTFFLGDVDYPSQWEPSGTDFLSPALCEADLLRRVLPSGEFSTWFTTFLPTLAEPGDVLLELPEVRDETDGHAVHLYGLALSRAAQLRALAPHLDRARARIVREASDDLVAHALPAVTDGDFMSTHWLVSFALLAELMR